ncbi:MAG: 30S ribosomal protein S6 [Candidatus Pacebacteria bacterium]|nr:30S ribosomal protein S6 [Candidatus Paceibacterota bacterium]MDR3582929.1 30S ribosomal protein S6 [Candidatus Paceibacterota bacterium]
MRYELFYLISGSKEAEVEKVKAEIKKLVTEAGGVFEEKETQEKRKLAYKIKHDTHGVYVASRFELENAESLNDISSKLNLNGGVLRFLLSRASELPELKTKEERINEALQKESAPQRRKEEKTAKEKAPTEVKPIEKKKETVEAAPKEKPAAETLQEEAPEEKSEEDQKKQNEDIDKKLEEILNI